MRSLAQKMQRIRKRRFVFVTLKFCQPIGRRAGWVVEATPLRGEDVQLAARASLRRALDDARVAANRLYDENGEPMTAQETDPECDLI